VAKQTTAKTGSGTLGEIAEGLGTLLGNAEKQWRAWQGPRDAVVKAVTDVRDRAAALLSEMKTAADAAAGKGSKKDKKKDRKSKKDKKGKKARKAEKAAKAESAKADKKGQKAEKKAAKKTGKKMKSKARKVRSATPAAAPAPVSVPEAGDTFEP